MQSSGWREVLLEQVADELTVGYVGPMATEYVPTGVPFLRSQNVEALRVNRNDLKFITPEFHERIRKSALKPGDVVIVRTGKPGACSVVPNSLPVANCSDLVIVRCGKDLDARFLAYYVNTAAAHHVSAHLVGAVQQHFNVGSARKLKMRLPRINEQRAIAQVLSALDDKIELNRRMNETLEAMAQALFKSWFVNFDPGHAKAAGRNLAPELDALFPSAFEPSVLGEIPKGWRSARLATVCETITSGGTPSTQNPEFWGGGIPWLSSGETRSRFITSTEKTITRAGVVNSSTRQARSGATVIAGAGQGHTRGQTSLLLLDCYINQSVVAATANGADVSDLYLFFDLQRRYEQFRQISDSHSSRGSLTTKLLSDLNLVVPPLRVVLAFDGIAQPIVQQIGANLRQSNTLSDLRDTLLPKLLSGDVRVRDAEKIVEEVA